MRTNANRRNEAVHTPLHEQTGSSGSCRARVSQTYLGVQESSANLSRRQDLPTPESPINSSLILRSEDQKARTLVSTLALDRQGGGRPAFSLGHLSARKTRSQCIVGLLSRRHGVLKD